MFIILLGVPGAGKGTQAELLEKKYNIPQISTGELFRKEISENTELGQRIHGYVEGGDLVPDDMVLEVFEKRIQDADCFRGAIFDGVPRTINQAQKLDEMLNKQNKKVDYIFFIHLEEEEIVTRLSGRWSCRQEGHVYHSINNPPKVPGICDFDQSELYQRDDQKDEAIRERILVFEKNTQPLIDYFNTQGRLITINGKQPIDKVQSDIVANVKINP